MWIVIIETVLVFLVLKWGSLLENVCLRTMPSYGNTVSCTVCNTEFWGLIPSKGGMSYTDDVISRGCGCMREREHKGVLGRAFNKASGWNIHTIRYDTIRYDTKYFINPRGGNWVPPHCTYRTDKQFNNRQNRIKRYVNTLKYVVSSSTRKGRAQRHVTAIYSLMG